MRTIAIAVVSLLVWVAITGCASVGETRAELREPPRPAAAGRGMVVDAEEGRFRAECQDFPRMVAEKQHSDVWCWAACAAMIHAYHGKPITQAEIARLIHGANNERAEGTPEARAASFYEVMRALNPDIKTDPFEEFVERLGAGGSFGVSVRPDQYLVSQAQRHTVNTDILVEDLARGDPVVVGLRDDPQATMGHAYVVYSSTAVKDESTVVGAWFRNMTKDSLAGRLAAEKYALHSLRAVDPWTGESVELTAENFAARVDFMISRRESREILTKEDAAIEFR